jgi:RNA polymerase sigma-70 factor (ECF subfamily)
MDFRTGPSEKFGNALLQHLDSLYGLAMTLSRRQTDAEDLVQQTYMRALESWDGFEPGTNLKAWLFTILRNLWINQRRSKQSQVSARLREEEPETEDNNQDRPDECLERKIERLEVRKAIENLPLAFREAVVLRDMEGLSYREIAEILGCPVGTVMSRVGRGHANLRESLGERRSQKRNMES